MDNLLCLINVGHAAQITGHPIDQNDDSLVPITSLISGRHCSGKDSAFTNPSLVSKSMEATTHQWVGSDPSTVYLLASKMATLMINCSGSAFTDTLVPYRSAEGPESLDSSWDRRDVLPGL